jgi:hypothetical protein
MDACPPWFVHRRSSTPSVFLLPPPTRGTLANGEVFEIGKITAWQPGSRLAFSWRQSSFRDDQVTHVEIRFEPIGEETRITVEHLGWDSVPQEHVARHGFPEGAFLRRCGEWWQTQLASYRGTVS